MGLPQGNPNGYRVSDWLKLFDRIVELSYVQSRTQSPQAFWSAVGRQERL